MFHPDSENAFTPQPLDGLLPQHLGVKLSILPLYKVHPWVQGNKYWKLLPNIDLAKANHCNTVLTFGGAYSNHLVATAAMAQAYGLASIGIVRGAELASMPDNKRSPALKQCLDMGMDLHYINRQQYQQLTQQPLSLQSEKPESYKTLIGDTINISLDHKTYIIPEGGTNTTALRGTQALGTLINEAIAKAEGNAKYATPFTHVFIAAATGGTAAGIALTLSHSLKLEVVAVLKDATWLSNHVANLQTQVGKRPIPLGKLHLDFHCGGYAKVPDFLMHYVTQVYKNYHIPLDGVYNGKTIWAIHQLALANYFPQGSNVLMLHTGGIFSWQPCVPKSMDYNN